MEDRGTKSLGHVRLLLNVKGTSRPLERLPAPASFRIGCACPPGAGKSLFSGIYCEDFAPPDCWPPEEMC
jgi:hypothetical protein